MNLFARTKKLVTANLHDLFDRLDHPEQLARQSLRELEQAIGEATAATARSLVAERLLRRQHDEQTRLLGHWQQRAELALQAGVEPLARQALNQQYAATQSVSHTAARLAEATETNARLREQLVAMRTRYQQARDRLAAESAKLATATAVQQFRAVGPASVGTADVFAELDRELNGIERAAMEAQARAELDADEGIHIEQHFTRREQETFIDAELARLKAKSEASATGSQRQ